MGKNLPTSLSERVSVRLVETDGTPDGAAGSGQAVTDAVLISQRPTSTSSEGTR